MDFSVSEDLERTLGVVRDFLRDEIVPLERAFLTRPFSEIEHLLTVKREQVRAMGLLAPHMAKAHGGAGFSLVDFALIAEELGRSPLGHYVFNCQAPDSGNMELLARHGDARQKRALLEPLVAGEIRSCFAMTEPDRAGSNPAFLDTTAQRDQGDYVIEGRKWFASAADGAAFAVVMAITNPDDPSPYRRASMIVVPTATPGFIHVRNIPVMGETNEGYPTHAEIVFDGCRVPIENRIGPEGAGFLLAQERLGPGRIHHCMRWLGICARAFDLMCERAASRELEPGVVLGSRQIVQEWIAECRAEIDAARLLVLKAAWSIERDGAAAARIEISTIKYFVANVLQRVVDRSLQVHGALGMSDDTPLSWWYRHERGARIYDGADEVHKSSVARHILRRYGAERV